jgi:hypothetical protein
VRTDHLVALRQIDPQLKAVHPAALTLEVFRWHLGMHHASAGSHPLHVARPQTAGVAVRVTMLHLARDHVGNGLEAAMRMVGSALGLARREFHRPHLVEQQERIEQRHLLVWERPVHNEARALELARRVDDIRH